MSPREQPPADRRAFVTGLVRWAALAGVAGVSAYLLARGEAGASDPQCPLALRCAQCPAQRACRLPQAASFPETPAR